MEKLPDWFRAEHDNPDKKENGSVSESKKESTGIESWVRSRRTEILTGDESAESLVLSAEDIEAAEQLLASRKEDLAKLTKDALKAPGVQAEQKINGELEAEISRFRESG